MSDTTTFHESITDLLRAWHETERNQFEARCPNLDFDSYDKKHYTKGRRWINLDAGTGGVFMLEYTTGLIYRIKAYGRPHLRKLIGQLGHVNGERLARLRHW